MYNFINFSKQRAEAIATAKNLYIHLCIFLFSSTFDLATRKKINSQNCLEHNTFVEHLMRSTNLCYLFFFLSLYLSVSWIFLLFFLSWFTLHVFVPHQFQNIVFRNIPHTHELLSRWFCFSPVSLSENLACFPLLRFLVPLFSKEKFDFVKKVSLFVLFLIEKCLHIRIEWALWWICFDFDAHNTNGIKTISLKFIK